MKDCTNCWNSPCTCGLNRRMHKGIIDPYDYYDGKGTKSDPLRDTKVRRPKDYVVTRKGSKEAFIDYYKSGKVKIGGIKNCHEKLLKDFPEIFTPEFIRTNKISVSNVFLEEYGPGFTWEVYTALKGY